MITNPNEIERRSFEIIGKEINLEGLDKKERPIITRVIHTTADFEYGSLLTFHPEAVAWGLKALKNGCRIYTDTRMIHAGINKKRLAPLGCEVYTLIDDPAVMEESKQKGITRSMIGMEKAARDEATKIFIIGNAPTALFKLKELIDTGKVNPHLVIAVPVGFVGAAESKEEICQTDTPWIITKGRKGGSTVAVAILHGLLYQL